MLSLGHFFHQKKLSLQGQETEAHGAFLKVIELMNSHRATDHIEAVQLCGQICSRYASPTIVNSAFMRIAEAFKNGTNSLQMEVLKVVQRNAACLRKVHNYTEFIRPIFTVMYSNDPVARSVTLRLLAAIAVSIPDQLDVHHAIRMALQSDNRSELSAALYASTKLAMISGTFAEAIAADVVVLLDKKDLSDEERIAVLNLVPFVTSSQMDSEYILSRIDGFLHDTTTESHSSRLVEASLRTVTDLASRASGENSVEKHLARLRKWTSDPRPEIVAISSSELVRFFQSCAVRIPSDLAVAFILSLLESGNTRLIRQGLKCAAVLLNDPLADYSSFLSEKGFWLIANVGRQIESTTAGFAFYLLCRILALRNQTAEPRSSVIVKPLEVKSDGLTDEMTAFLELLSEIMASKPNEKTMRFVCLGLHSCNTEHLSPGILDGCLTILSDTTKGVSAGSAVHFLRFLLDISSSRPEFVAGVVFKRKLVLERSAGTDQFVLAKLMTAVRFAVMDANILKENISPSDFIKDFDLSAWDKYRMARTALAAGRHVFATSLLESIVDTSELGKSSLVQNWIGILLRLTRAESSSDLSERTGLLMNIQLGMGDFRKSTRFGVFKKLYLDIRLQLGVALDVLIAALESLRIRLSEMGDEPAYVPLISSYLSASLQTFKTVEQDVTRLLTLMFDADGPSLAIVKFNRRICVVLNALMAKLSGKEMDRFSKLGTVFRGTEPVWEAANKMLSATIPWDQHAEIYSAMRTLHHTASFFSTFAMPIPRYFVQQYQQTTLSVNMTPAPTVDREYSSVLNMETKFTLKVEGALSVESSSTADLMRSVRSIRTTVRRKIVKSLPFSSKALYNSDTSPETMTHLSPMKDLNFFAHTFVMSLGYPGVYKLSVEFDFEDENLWFWNAFQSVDLTVKVTEGAGSARR